MAFLIKKISNLIWHHSDTFSEVTLSKFSIVIDHTRQTIIIKEENGSNFPQKAVNVIDVILLDEFGGGVEENEFTTQSLQIRLSELGYIGFMKIIGIEEAPIDGFQYVRKNGGWVVVIGGGGGGSQSYEDVLGVNNVAQGDAIHDSETNQTILKADGLVVVKKDVNSGLFYKENGLFYQLPLSRNMSLIFDEPTTLGRVARIRNIDGYLAFLSDIPIPDGIPTNESANPITSGGVFDALEDKFDNPTGNNTQYLDGAGTPTTFPNIPSISGLATEDYVDNGLALKEDKKKFLRINTSYVLTATTDIQKIFNVGTGESGAFEVLANKTYEFELIAYITNLPSTSTFRSGFLGTATISSITALSSSSKQSTLEIARTPQDLVIKSTTPVNLTSANALTTGIMKIKGEFKTSSSGTFIIGIGLPFSGSITGTINPDSKITLKEIGSDSVTSN